MQHTREAIIEQTTCEFELLDRLVSNLSEEEWLRPVPRPASKEPWTVKDALAHIALRKADYAALISGKPRPAEQFNASPTRGFRLLLQHWREQPPEKVLAFHRQIQLQVLDALAAAPEEALNPENKKTEWPNDLVSHSAHHRMRDIQKALDPR